MTTQEQQDAWLALCDEAASVGLWLVHIPDGCLFTVYPWPKDSQVIYLRYNVPEKAIAEAKRSIAFKRMYPIPTSSPEELKERLTAFNTQYAEG